MSAASTVQGSDRPEPLLEGLLRAGPRFVERSRRQAEFAAVVVHGLRRLGGSRRPGGPQAPLVEAPTADDPPIAAVREPTVLDRVPASPVVSGTPTPVPEVPAPAAGPEEADLPIDGYDSLAASQVVPRLVTLSPDELRTVQRYEQAGRHRQTILNRVAQLLAGR